MGIITYTTTLCSYADYRSEKNQKAVQAYIEALENRPEFTGYNEVTGIYVTDIDQDGVVEFIVQCASELEEENPGRHMSSDTMLLSYGDDLSVECIDSGGAFHGYAYVGVIPDEKKLAVFPNYSNTIYMSQYSLENAKPVESNDDSYSYHFYYFFDEEAEREENAKAMERYQKIVLLRYGMIENLEDLKAHMGDGSTKDPLYPVYGSAFASDMINHPNEYGW